MIHIGLIGLGTMGANLARNAARNGATVSVFNRTTEKTDAFMKAHKKEGEFVPSHDLKEFVQSIPAPRAIILMVKAGPAVDEMMKELEPMMTKNDIIIDAGNSHYRDTARRIAEAKAKGFRFLGMGVSGGEKGALLGPSMMPGGDKSAFDHLQPLLEKMSADDGDGGKCVTYLGEGGAGHFVKMVHNGIEYGIMQLIAESYHLLKSEAGLSNQELAELYGDWSKSGYLASFLMEITAEVFNKKDDVTGGDLVDVIQDAAAQKGTGKWTTDCAMEYGVAVPTITAAVDARIMSSAKAFRVLEAERTPLKVSVAKKDPDLVSHIRSALECSIINSYAQGFQLLATASEAEKWNLNLSEIARIWRGGCIIRSALLKESQLMFTGDAESAARVRERFSAEHQKAWRSVVALGALRGIPLPAMSASLSYYDAFRTARLPQNLVQAQRDLFGAHTFQRVDKEGIFHVDWEA